MHALSQDLAERLKRAVNRDRLLDTAVRLIEVPSRTGEAGAVADRLADLLRADRFEVERPDGGYPAAPAVAARFKGNRPGRTMQFNGHLDTVHLPFVPPRVDGDRLTGSGSSDMKSGVAAAVEALRAIRDVGLPAGSILLTAHDLHEAPWGDGRQLDRLIADGFVGDGVLLPEYLHECLPVIGRGGFVWKAVIRRSGPPVHEVLRPRDEPNVIAAGAELVRQLVQLDQRLSKRTDPLAGSDSLFIGQIHCGEIFNQYPQECRLEGTRRWLPGLTRADAEAELRGILDEVEKTTGTTVSVEFHPMRDAFVLDPGCPLATAFQAAHAEIAGNPLPIGAKPFVDDGNSFWALAKIPAITHGPRAGGAHTLNEWVSVDDLVRVARVYALTAVAFCSEAG